LLLNKRIDERNYLGTTEGEGTGASEDIEGKGEGERRGGRKGKEERKGGEMKVRIFSDEATAVMSVLASDLFIIIPCIKL
jgi:hypothetical protein